jgi:hypothetical protein
LQPSSTIPNIAEPCPTLRITEDDNTVSDFEDDEEVNENGPWNHAPALAGQFVPHPTVEEATLALDDLKLILRPPRNSGGSQMVHHSRCITQKAIGLLASSKEWR